jgi:hypothetical protein
MCAPHVGRGEGRAKHNGSCTARGGGGGGLACTTSTSTRLPPSPAQTPVPPSPNLLFALIAILGHDGCTSAVGNGGRCHSAGHFGRGGGAVLSVPDDRCRRFKIQHSPQCLQVVTAAANLTNARTTRMLLARIHGCADSNACAHRGARGVLAEWWPSLFSSTARLRLLRYVSYVAFPHPTLPPPRATPTPRAAAPSPATTHGTTHARVSSWREWLCSVAAGSWWVVPPLAKGCGRHT